MDDAIFFDSLPGVAGTGGRIAAVNEAAGEWVEVVMVSVERQQVGFDGELSLWRPGGIGSREEGDGGAEEQTEERPLQEPIPQCGQRTPAARRLLPQLAHRTTLPCGRETDR